MGSESEVQSTGREGEAARVGGRSRDACSQDAERDECWYSACLLLLFVPSGTPANTDWYHPDSGWAISSLLILSRNALADRLQSS